MHEPLARQWSYRDGRRDQRRLLGMLRSDQALRCSCPRSCVVVEAFSSQVEL